MVLTNFDGEARLKTAGSNKEKEERSVQKLNLKQKIKPKPKTTLTPRKRRNCVVLQRCWTTR